jgi:hypothetical protein
MTRRVRFLCAALFAVMAAAAAMATPAIFAGLAALPVD